jgi:phosphoglycolate phosphatase
MAEPGWPRAIICDLDGTVIDSVADMTVALNAALTAHGYDHVPIERVRNMIGAGAGKLISRALADLGVDGADDHQSRLIFDAFIAAYIKRPADLTELYDGADAVLATWHGEGRKLGICTNKPQAITDVIISEMQLDRYFATVVGANDGVAKKPAPDMLQAVLGALDCAPQEAVMIGDSLADVGAAKAAGVPVVLLSFGYSPHPAGELGADTVVDHWSAIPAAIAGLRP